MVLTVVSLAALLAAFAYLLWSIGAQYPDRSMRTADRPDREQRFLRHGSDMGAGRRPRRGLRDREPPALDDPGLPTRLGVDRGLARVLIDEAAAAGAGRRELSRAWRDLKRGDRRAAAGRHREAAERYGRAWVRAGRALERARSPMPGRRRR
jgi:hypothetical protein